MSPLAIASLCSTYMVIGPSIIILNRYILHDIVFPFPIFLSALGVLFSGVTAQVLVRLGYVKIQKKEALQGINFIKHILPVCLIYAVSLALGNTAYLFLSINFIQMFKSFVPVLLMITAYMAGVETPSKPVITSVLIICIGTHCTYNVYCSYINLTIYAYTLLF